MQQKQNICICKTQISTLEPYPINTFKNILFANNPTHCKVRRVDKTLAYGSRGNPRIGFDGAFCDFDGDSCILAARLGAMRQAGGDDKASPAAPLKFHEITGFFSN